MSGESKFIENARGNFPIVREVAFAEAGAAGVYTGSIVIPAGATIHDVIVHGTALWTAGTSALMDVGDAADPDGFFTQIDLKATDLLAGESVSFALAAAKQAPISTTARPTSATVPAPACFQASSPR
jgi:hypothetical protein